MSFRRSPPPLGGIRGSEAVAASQARRPQESPPRCRKNLKNPRSLPPPHPRVAHGPRRSPRARTPIEIQWFFRASPEIPTAAMPARSPRGLAEPRAEAGCHDRRLDRSSIGLESCLSLPSLPSFTSLSVSAFPPTDAPPATPACFSNRLIACRAPHARSERSRRHNDSARPTTIMARSARVTMEPGGEPVRGTGRY